ncbi:MAG: carbon starvation protein A, partial [Alphaproteobacteria bacterium]|nr:carbon starvation protein A [Alphaproteobacteria bacterium]
AENLNIDQKPKKNRLAITIVMLAGVAFLLYFAKANGGQFIKLWRYFAWSNQTIAVFTFTVIALYLIEQRKTFLFVLVPGTFYLFVITSYILHQEIGFGLSDSVSYGLAGVLSAVYAAGIIWKNKATNKKN